MSDEMTHVEAAVCLVDAGQRDAFTAADLLAAAQVHATLALVEAIENWRPPEPPDEEPAGVSPEEFGRRWGR